MHARTCAAGRIEVEVSCLKLFCEVPAKNVELRILSAKRELKASLSHAIVSWFVESKYEDDYE